MAPNSLLALYGQGYNPLLSDAEVMTTANVVNAMLRNQLYEASLFGKINAFLQRQHEGLEGASAFNPVNMLLEAAGTANRWLGALQFPERVQQGDVLAPLGLGAMAAPFAVRGAIGSAGGKLRPAKPLAEGSASGDPRVVGGTAGRTEMLSEDPSVSRVTAYHGSPNTFALFDEETVPWFSTSERTAERFGADRASNAYHHNASSLQRLKNAGKLHLYRADIEGRILDNDPMAEAAIIAREIGVEEPKTWDEVAELLQWADYQTQIINDARRQGFDAVRFRNVGDDPVGAISDHIAVLNPQAIKNFTQLYADQSRSYLPGTVINAAAEGSRNDRKWRKATNEGARPEPSALNPKAEAMGTSSVLAETRSSVPVRDVASQVADALGFSVWHSTSPMGYSSYLRTPIGDIRISDHPTGEFRALTELQYDYSQGADAIIADILRQLQRAKQKTAMEREASARERQKRLERTAPIRAEQAANREAKERFWRERGLENATQTAKDKAWKAFKRGELP